MVRLANKGLHPVKVVFTLLAFGVVIFAAWLGYSFPEKSLLIAPHAITVSAILAGIIAAVQSVLSARIEKTVPIHDRENKVLQAEAKELLKGMYDQLLVYMLVIVSALAVIWSSPTGSDTDYLGKALSILFMSLFAFAIVLTLRMPGYLRALAE